MRRISWSNHRSKTGLRSKTSSSATPRRWTRATSRAWRGCFTEDGWLDSPIVRLHQGEASLREFAERIAKSKRRGAQFRHAVSNFRIDVAGDRGRARCYLLDFATVAGKCELLSSGEYDCELRRVGGEWLFASRIVRMDRSFSIP